MNKTRKKSVRTNNNLKNKKNVTLKKRFTSKHYNSDDGMLTNVWGPSLWLFLHTISFNYPVNPTKKDKERYKKFISLLQYILPCRYCRENFKNNLKSLPLSNNVFKSRNNFSKYLYKLHEHINTMLGKQSNLTYNQVRERYERFRSRCNKTKKNSSFKLTTSKISKTRKKTEKGCTDPLNGKKAKCVIHIVPFNKKCNTFNMDKQLN